MRGEWYDEVRRFTERLVAISSVSPGPGEIAVAREVLALLYEDGLQNAYTESGLDPLEGDPHARVNAYAFLKGASPRAVLLLGHIDTVETGDYGPLEPWALQPDDLLRRADELATFTPGLGEALARHPGDWMLGRGTIDMKSGVAANIAVMRHLARRARTGELPLSVVLLATPDEENESAGVLQGVRFLERLRQRHGLEYLGALNTDYTAPRSEGDTAHYIYTGTIGKLLPCFLVVGRESHVGEPFNGVDANLLAAELIRDLSMNPDLCDRVRGQSTPPPVTLRAADLKEHYDVQLPFAAYFYLNVLTFSWTPAELLETLSRYADAAMARTLARIDDAEQRWCEGTSITPQHAGLRSGKVLTYATLRAAAERRVGAERVAAALAEEWKHTPERGDSRERSLRLVYRVWTLSGLKGPAIVVYYAPPYYPHIAAVPCDPHAAVRGVAASHPELGLRVEEYYPYISDMSYLRLDPGVDLRALTDNMPVWRTEGEPARPGSYSLPLDTIRALNLPVVNLGPYGAGAHQRGERLLMSYSFGVLPQLLLETIDRLAG